MTLYIDADACPVKAEAERVTTRLQTPMVLVSNGGIRPSANPLVSSVYVGAGLDEADRWIADRAGPGDVVVTSDIPLAARVIEGGAVVVKPDGQELTPANIGVILATRDLMTDLRSADPFRQGGGKSFSKADRSRFLETLDRLLRRAASVKVPNAPATGSAGDPAADSPADSETPDAPPSAGDAAPPGSQE